mgnify:CR=1 FL=1
MAADSANVLVGVATLSVKYPAGTGEYVEVGYTEDGVSFEYSADVVEIEVEEETYPLEQFITREHIKVTCNMAESSLFNIDKAIAGSVLAGSVITIGGGVMKEMGIQIVGKNPDGFARTIEIPLASATGTVGMSYRKTEKTIVPVEFTALKPATGNVCTITDAAV